MSEMIKVKAEEPGGLSLVPPIPAATSSEPEQKQDDKDLMLSVHQMLIVKEEVSHGWSCSPDHGDLEPPRIKNEEKELWVSTEEDQFMVQSEEERPLISELHQIKAEDNSGVPPTCQSAEQNGTKSDGEDGGKADPVMNQDQVYSFQQSKVTFHKKDESSKLSSAPGAQSERQTVEKPFGCNVCGKMFKHHHSVKLHMITHAAKTEHICDLCGKGFRVKSRLEMHMRLHTGNRPFACDICCKKFYTKHNLKSHMRVHSVEKPFGCDICGRTFKEIQTLRTHLLLHTTERPFVCSVCEKGFFTKISSEKSHVQSHRRETLFLLCLQ